MADVISNAVQKLTSVIDQEPIDWIEFDRVLDEIEDMPIKMVVYPDNMYGKFKNVRFSKNR